MVEVRLNHPQRRTASRRAVDLTCEAVRERFTLEPVVAFEVSRWTGNWYRLDPLAGAPPIGLYRIPCPDDAARGPAR